MGLGNGHRSTSCRRPSASATRRPGWRRPTAPTRPTVLAWLGGADLDDRPRRRRHADPGPHPGDDRDDRRDARHPLGRALPPRARGVRAAGERGLARGAVRRAAGAHPRVRRDRADGAAPRAGDVRRARTSPCRCRTGPGKALRLTIRPPRADLPDLPRRGRPAEPAARRRDRRRLARASSSRPSTRADQLGRRARRSRGGGRPGHARATRWPGFDVVADGAGRRHRRPRGGRAAAAPTTPRSTSAGWAAASRTSTTRSPAGWASSEAADDDPGPLPRRPAPRRRGCRAVRAHRRDGADRPAASGSPSGSAATPTAGVTTLSVAPYAATTRASGPQVLRTVADAARPTTAPESAAEPT